MISRAIGIATLSILALSALDHYGMIQIKATPLKQLSDAFITLGEIAGTWLQAR